MKQIKGSFVIAVVMLGMLFFGGMQQAQAGMPADSVDCDTINIDLTFKCSPKGCVCGFGQVCLEVNLSGGSQPYTCISPGWNQLDSDTWRKCVPVNTFIQVSFEDNNGCTATGAYACSGSACIEENDLKNEEEECEAEVTAALKPEPVNKN